MDSQTDHADALAEHAPAASRRIAIGGMFLLLGAACLWSLNGALIKLTNQNGEGPDAIIIAFYRSLIAGLCLIPLARGKYHTLLARNRGPHHDSAVDGGERASHPSAIVAEDVSGKSDLPLSGGPPKRPTGKGLFGLKPAACGCVVAFTLMTVCFVAANTMTKAANAIILQYTSTFWVFGLSPWLLKERPAAADVRILMLAFGGIVVIFMGDASTDFWGLMVALGAGLFYGLLTMAIRTLRDADAAALTVLNNIGSAVLMLPWVLLQGGLLVSPRSFVLLIIMGVFQFGLPYYLFSLGLRRAPAYQAAFITMAEPVLVPVWTYCAVGEAVTIPTAIGGVVILAALIIFGLSFRKNEPRLAG